MRVMGKVLLIIALVVTLTGNRAWAEGKHTTWNPTTKERPNIATWIPHRPDDVLLTFEGIAMPLGRILLARKGSDYCVIKFTDTWLGETEKDHYSSYEFYYQGDGSGDFTKSNVLSGSGELYFPRVRPIIFDMGYQKGRNTTLQCGVMKFDWLFIGWIYLQKYELAPTPWTTIKEVNIKDPRVRWYKKNEVKERVSIPVDELWDSAMKGTTPSEDKHEN